MQPQLCTVGCRDGIPSGYCNSRVLGRTRHGLESIGTHGGQLDEYWSLYTPRSRQSKEIRILGVWALRVSSWWDRVAWWSWSGPRAASLCPPKQQGSHAMPPTSAVDTAEISVSPELKSMAETRGRACRWGEAGTAKCDRQGLGRLPTPKSKKGRPEPMDGRRWLTTVTGPRPVSQPRLDSENTMARFAIRMEWSDNLVLLD